MKDRGVLTESMFYVLMAFLRREMCGIEITEFVERKTNGRVRLGPGTLYTLLGKFLDERLIEETHTDGRKRSYRMHDSLDDVTELAAWEEPETKELLEMVWNLPDKYKDVIILHYLEGYSVEEAARILGVSSSAVKMRLKRGRESLRVELEKE